MRCGHPPKLCRAEDGVTTCLCGARIFTDYRALGGAALDIAEHSPDPPVGRTTTGTGTGMFTCGSVLWAEGTEGSADETDRSDRYVDGDRSCR